MLQQLRLQMGIIRLCETYEFVCYFARPKNKCWEFARPKKNFFLLISEFLRLMLQVMFRAFHFSTLNDPCCKSETHVATLPDPFCNFA